MKIRKSLSIFSPIFGAIGLLVFLFDALPSASATPEVPIPNPNKQNDVTTDRWRILASMLSGRGDPGVVALNNKIHVVSGFYSPGFGYSSSQEIYDPQTNTWQSLGNFPVPRSDMVVENVGGKIYAIGGWNTDLGGALGNNNRYDPTLDTWITMTSMITPVSGAGGVVMSNTIYIIGGFNGISETAQVQIYNTTNDSWSIGTPLPGPRGELEAELFNGLIYVIGGSDTTSDIEIYNPVNNSWTNGPPLPENRYSMASAERNGLIYIFGGEKASNNGNVVDTTFIYNPASGVWSIGDPMPTAREACAATVLSDTIYVIGGVGEPGAGTANEAYGNFDLISSTTSIVTDSPDPSPAFQPFSVGYLVTTTFGVPTGVVTVTVDQNNANCSGQLMSGTGSCELTLDTPGTYTITATYSGDINYAPSSGSTRHEVINILKLYLPTILKN